MFKWFISLFWLAPFFFSAISAAHAIKRMAIVVWGVQKFSLRFYELQRLLLRHIIFIAEIFNSEVGIWVYIFFVAKGGKGLLCFVSLSGSKLVPIRPNSIFATSSASLRQNSALISLKARFILTNRELWHLSWDLYLHIWQFFSQLKVEIGHGIAWLDIESVNILFSLATFHFLLKFIHLSVNKSFQKHLLTFAIRLQIRVKSVQIGH